MSDITFTALGGGSEIGANCYLIECEGHQVVLDCGMHPKKDGVSALPDLNGAIHKPDAVVVTHAHVDHCGAVPYLMKLHPKTACYATHPTVSIMDRMLHNSVSVMGTLALEKGIHEYPLYTHTDADEAIRRTYAMDFSHEFALTWDTPFRAVFYRAGHVLGAAGVLLKMPNHTLFYTGDVCATEQELLPGMAALDELGQVDTLIIESTRGAKDESGLPTLKTETARFAKAITEVLDRGGVVLIPAFALGRTQELLNVISRLVDEGRVPDVPVYASGLGRAIYEIYNRYRDYLKPGSGLRRLSDYKRIGDVWERSVRRNLLREPCILVATSGMMVENTPSAMLAQEMVQHEKHGIFFVGYLDPDTLGYQVLHAKAGERLTFERGSHSVKVRLENMQTFNFSAHAPREDLLKLVEKIKPRNVVYVHGDTEALETMHTLTGEGYKKYIPVIGEPLTLER
ncbi:MAG: MBL fold metallo-hydrolase [Candidatus Hydrogenedentes bacterium]|nr:MBL fold metallo-hydrolase [Candidatus Hydrogenedentota bacterium]